MLRVTLLFGLPVFSYLWLFPLRTQAATSEPLTGAAPVCFQTDFAGTGAANGWQGPLSLETGYAGKRALALEAKPDTRGATASRTLSLEGIRGSTLRCTAMVRASDVSAKPQPWNGVKYMLVIHSPTGISYPQAPLETGTFDWQRAAFTAKVPADATNLSLVLGLEQVTGKVWFSDVKIVVAKAPLTNRPPAVTGPMFKGHRLPRLRGAMISPGIDADSLRVLGQEWNANLLRWQLIRSGRPGQGAALDTYDDWLESELKRLDAALPLCEKYGLLAVVDLHSPPGGKGTAGGYMGSDAGLFTERACQDHFVEVWRRIAARYRGQKNIWGFDLVNEPVEDNVEEGCADWQGLVERAARAVRAIDPDRTLIVEPTHWGSPEGLEDLVPLPFSNVVYSVHMYVPHAFTHQGVFAKGPSYVYPGRINGQQWDKAALEQALKPAIDFQRRYNVHIYIGEFSAIRWAPDHSAYRYLSDLIDIFEAHDWDWSYHAFREWNGWSVEHGPDPKDNERAKEPTDRQKLLCDWFAQNQKPGQR